MVKNRKDITMKYTSAEAAKLIRRLNNERNTYLYNESQTSSFLASVGEDVESVRPKYDYEDTRRKIADIEAKIIKVKHALNVFNATHTIESLGMTVDEVLVYIPMLNKKLSVLDEMRNALPKARESSGYRNSSNIIDYRYANYDIEKVSEDYNKASEELAAVQLALDKFNNTETFEIDI